MASNGFGADATHASIEMISKQIDAIASEAQAADLPGAAEVLRAMAQLMRSLGSTEVKAAGDKSDGALFPVTVA